MAARNCDRGSRNLYPGANAENVLVTCGGSEANFVATSELLEPGDEVVFMMPNYMQISGNSAGDGRDGERRCGCANRSTGALNVDDLPRVVTAKTKLIAICNPNNPTGSVLRDDMRAAIVAAAAKVGAWILSDEVYRGAEFDGEMTPSLWGGYDRILCTGGLSKAYSLPGLRTGWVVGPPEMIEKLWGYHDYTSIGPSMLTDRLASLALEPQRRAWILNRTREILRRNYAPLRAWLDSHANIFSHVAPKAGAIAWAGLRDGRNTAQMAEELRVKKRRANRAWRATGHEVVRDVSDLAATPHICRRRWRRIDEWLGETRAASAS